MAILIEGKLIYTQKLLLFPSLGQFVVLIHATFREWTGSRDPEKSHSRIPNPEFSKSRDFANTK